MFCEGGVGILTRIEFGIDHEAAFTRKMWNPIYAMLSISVTIAVAVRWNSLTLLCLLRLFRLAVDRPGREHWWYEMWHCDYETRRSAEKLVCSDVC